MGATAERAIGALYLVASLTTSPKGIRSIGPTLQSLSASQQQRPFDEVILNLPTREEPRGTFKVPPSVARVATVNYVDDDWGPATKLVPTVRYLLRSRLPAIAATLGLPLGPGSAADAVMSRTHIVLVDDDVVYPRGMALSLGGTASPRTSEAASGFVLVPRTLKKPRGFELQSGPHGAPLDVAEAHAGWRVPLGAFDADVERFEGRARELLSDADARASDDLVLSAYLAERGIPLTLHQTAEHSAALLGAPRPLGGREDRLRRANSSSPERWARYWRLIDSGRCPALRVPERWDVLCPAQLQPLPAPACRNLSGTAEYHLLGERHSGTNALASLITRNFGATSPSFRETFKHMWTTDAPADLADMSARLGRLHADGLPVVLIVREPLQWLLAMQVTPHHTPWMRFLPMSKFVGAEWLSWKVDAAHARCVRLGLIGPNGTAADKISQLWTSQQRRCAVHAFNSILALRSAKLKLMRDAFELRPADEATRREQLVHTVSRRGIPGSGPVLVLRYEDFTLRAQRMPCVLARHLRVCALRAHALFPTTTTIPGGANAEGFVQVAHGRGRLHDVSGDVCGHAARIAPAALEHILDNLDWNLEGLFGYGPARLYRACARPKGELPIELPVLPGPFGALLGRVTQKGTGAAAGTLDGDAAAAVSSLAAMLRRTAMPKGKAKMRARNDWLSDWPR